MVIAPSSSATRRVLYFDIDGTVVHETFGACKAALRDGMLEQLVRRAGFTELVCVSDAVSIARLLPGNTHDTVFDFCQGAFQDRQWFRTHVRLVPDPVQRARYVDARQDWFFADDHAFAYLRKAGRIALAHEGAAEGRVLHARSGSEGHELAAWLRSHAGAYVAPLAAPHEAPSIYARPDERPGRRSRPLVPVRRRTPQFA